MYEQKFMDEALQLAIDNVKKGTGGPFGAVIVKDGVKIASSGNSVTIDNDPTAHAEVNAIRKACSSLNSYQLDGCEIYCSCEPCPMCLGAIYWSRLAKVYYASTKEDAADAGFDDSFIYREIILSGDKRSIPFMKVHELKEGEEFRLWKTAINKVEY